MAAELSPSPIRYGRHARGPWHAKYPQLWEGFYGGMLSGLTGPCLGDLDDSPMPNICQAPFPTWFQWSESPIGAAWKSLSALNGAYIQWDSSAASPNKWKALDPPLTILAYLYSDGTDTDIPIYRSDGDRGVFGSHFLRGVHFFVNFLDYVGFATCDNTTTSYSTGASFLTTSGSALPLNRWTAILLTCSANTANGENCDFYNTDLFIDGESFRDVYGGMSHNGLAKLPVHANVVPALVNAKRPAEDSATGTQFGLVAAWSGAKEPAECRLLTTDPLAMWRRR